MFFGDFLAQMSNFFLDNPLGSRHQIQAFEEFS